MIGRAAACVLERWVYVDALKLCAKQQTFVLCIKFMPTNMICLRSGLLVLWSCSFRAPGGSVVWLSARIPQKSFPSSPQSTRSSPMLYTVICRQCITRERIRRLPYTQVQLHIVTDFLNRIHSQTCSACIAEVCILVDHSPASAYHLAYGLICKVTTYLARRLLCEGGRSRDGRSV